MTATERPSPPDPSGSEERDWEEISSQPEFQILRHRLRSFVFPMTGLFLGWYLLYVLLASYAPAFMAIKLFGNMNVGLVFGLLQFVSTFLITFLYVRFADRSWTRWPSSCVTTSRTAAAPKEPKETPSDPARPRGCGQQPDPQPGDLRAVRRWSRSPS